MESKVEDLFGKNEKGALSDISKKNFCMLASKFYLHNFGTFSKSDVDLFMFHVFEENHQDLTELEVAKQLGITPQRVRNLKFKASLVYPRDTDWKSSFKELIKKAQFYKNENKVDITIKDPLVLEEVKSYLETRNSVVEYQLNPKVLRVSKNVFLELLIEFESDEKLKSKITRLAKNQDAVEEILATESSWYKVKNVASVANVLMQAIPNCASILSQIMENG